jgi:hypothetical protein
MQLTRGIRIMANRRAVTNDKALAAFAAAKADIDARLERLKALSDDHFNATPDKIHWGHVGDLQRYASLLLQITDIAFSEGECAD